MTDIALSADRLVTGRFVDVEGRPIDGAVVVLLKERQAIARTTTDVRGSFQIRNVPAGVYRLSCGSAAGWIRCWSADAAPPNALTEHLTFQDGVVRGQAALLVPAYSTGTLVAGAATTGAVVSGISVSGATSNSRSPTDNGTPAPPQSIAASHDPYPPPGTLRPPAIRPSEDGARVEIREVDGELVRVIVPRNPDLPTSRNDFGDPRDNGFARLSAEMGASPSGATASVLSQPDRELLFPASP